MNRLFFFLLLPLQLFAADHLPMGSLDQTTLETFYPKIQEELSKELTRQSDGRTNRLTREYGYSFFKMEQGDRSYDPPPEFLEELGRKVCEQLGHPPQHFTNYIISLYETGFYLEPHVDINSDDPHEAGFYFSDNVYGLVLEADDSGHLYFIRHEDEGAPPLNGLPVCSLDEKAGMVFCLQGELRRTPYYHAVSRVAKRRVTVTFRAVHFSEKGDDDVVELSHS